MKYFLLFFAWVTLLTSCNKHNYRYPVTEKSNQQDNNFGTLVSDPYRWLEDDQSEKTEAWVKAENEVTFAYLEGIPFRDKVKSRIEELWNYEKYDVPYRKAGKIYYFKNDGLQNQYVMYVQDSLNGPSRVFLDPNTFSSDGTIALSSLSFTKDGSLFAYSISESGSDWQKILVMDPSTKKILDDTLKNVKFSGISWYKDEGFYYSAYSVPSKGSQLSGITEYHKLYYHRMGTPQSSDIMVFGGETTPRRYISGFVTEDQHYLIISAAESTSGNELYYKDLTVKDSKIYPLVTGFEYNNWFIDNNGNQFILETNYKAPDYRLMLAGPGTASPDKWKVLVPEKDEVLTDVGTAGGKLFLSYLKDASTHVYQYQLNGKEDWEIQLPALGTAGGFSGEKEDSSFFFYFTSFTYPTSIYQYHISTGKTELFKKPDVKFDPDQYVTEQVFYKSFDSTRIPMFIVHRKDMKKDGRNPLLLYGYGGFNISMTPYFSVRWLAWLDMGGIFALPNIRGGGEYGEKWHEAGTKMHKKNVFEDFEAAARYLQSNGYTSKDYTTINGASNGGLLVGAVMTRHPEICKVALPDVGVMDMLRYNRFTAGAGWISDYGCADSSKAMFEYLYSYSPVHNIRKLDYPATLVTTSDHDDRVVPAHSFKFAAGLQANQQGNSPVMIRIETKAGHGGGKPTSKIIQELADSYSFAWYNMKRIPSYARQ